jgi:hypothetical protein
VILTDAFGTARKNGAGGNEYLERAAIHNPLRYVARESGKLATWGVTAARSKLEEKGGKKPEAEYLLLKSRL